MQILDDDDPGAVRTQDLHEIAELPQHALSRGAENLIAEDDAIVVVEESRHLRQPGWSMGPQRREERRPIFAAAAFFQRLDQRQEGFIGPKQLGAAAPQYAGAATRQSLQRHFDQRRLADPGLAGDEHYLPISGKSLLNQAFERFKRGFPTDPPAL